MKITRTNKHTGETETIFEGKIDKVTVQKNTNEDQSESSSKVNADDTKVYADVILLTLLEIMGIERFRIALAMALHRLSGDSHLKIERKQAEEFYNVVSDLKYLRWKAEDFGL